MTQGVIKGLEVELHNRVTVQHFQGLGTILSTAAKHVIMKENGVNNSFILIFHLKQSIEKSHKNNGMTHCQKPESASIHRIYTIYMDIIIFALSNIKSQWKKYKKSTVYG